MMLLLSWTAIGLIEPVFATPTCTTVTPADTKFGLSITALVVAASSQTITGDKDATGCDVGVYIGPGITGVTVTATVHDALQAGVFNDGGAVTVTGSTVSDTGNHAAGVFSPNGVQTGIDIYFSCAGTGAISSNTINQYQKGGIVVRDLDSVFVTSNTVTGLGPFSLIGQNGIEFGFGSCGPTVSSSNVGHVTGNTVSGNIYTQGAQKGVISTGILAVAVSGSSVGQLTSALQTSNTVFGNQGNVVVIVG